VWYFLANLATFYPKHQVTLVKDYSDCGFWVAAPVLLSPLAGVPGGGVLELLGEGEALAVAPPLVRLILDVAVGAHDDLLAWNMGK